MLIGTAEYCLKLGQDFFSTFNCVRPISLICYEEVHCDFLFGKSFRKDILNVKPLFESIRAVRVSITASPIGGNAQFMAQLSGLSSSFYLSTVGLYRENLSISIKSASSNMLSTLVSLLSKEEQKTIIYCHKIESCVQLKLLLDEQLTRPYYVYNSRLSSQDKYEVYSDFEASTNGILICTKSQAFGVNYSNISNVVIWEIPDSLEILYQMMGRAAREGGKANLLVFHDKKLVQTYHNFIQKGNMSEEDKSILKRSLVGIQNLCSMDRCRWGTILSYLENRPIENWKCETMCDVCIDGVNKEEMDITTFALPILKFMQERRLSKSHLAYIVNGRPSEMARLPIDLRELATLEGIAGITY